MMGLDHCKAILWAPEGWKAALLAFPDLNTEKLSLGLPLAFLSSCQGRD